MHLLDPEILERLPDLAARARAVAQGALAGRHLSVQRGPAPELIDRRAYVPGDDPRRIDWRVFARTRELLVKQARRATDLPVHVVLDASASMAFRGPRAPRTKLDHARILAVAIAHVFLEAGDRVGLLAFGKGDPLAVAPRGGGRRRLVRIAAALERVEAGGTMGATAALRALGTIARRRGVVLLVSDFLVENHELEKTFHELRALAAHGHDVLLLQIRDPDEAELSLEGPWRFLDPETGARKDAHVGEVARRYAERAAEFAARVRELARGARIDHALASTDRSPVEPLAELVQARHRTRPRTGGLAS